ncbi:MAG: hypothetical protein K1X57_11525 [Gemmataceae bacterium]|nr:hypothetical protein [Gemmataceae bacterium]
MAGFLLRRNASLEVRPVHARYLIGTAVVALAVLLPVLYLSRPKSPVAQSGSAPASDFSTVVGRFEREAKVASTGQSTVLIGQLGEEVDGRRTMTATRANPTSTTKYTIQFRRLADRWVCCGATAEETEAGGGKNMHRLGGDPIEIDQLIIWLGWGNTGKPDASLPTPQARHAWLLSLQRLDLEPVTWRRAFSPKA